MEDDDEWDLHDLEFSWRVWRLLEATEWRFLPEEGGLLDQPSWLLEDLSVISWRKEIVRNMMQTLPMTKLSVQDRTGRH